MIEKWFEQTFTGFGIKWQFEWRVFNIYWVLKFYTLTKQQAFTAFFYTTTHDYSSSEHMVWIWQIRFRCLRCGFSSPYSRNHVSGHAFGVVLLSVCTSSLTPLDNWHLHSRENSPTILALIQEVTFDSVTLFFFLRTSKPRLKPLTLWLEAQLWCRTVDSQHTACFD